jgi:4-amino-4-deoxy-L-arabinose transferase-like glycosyltransferase
MFFFKFSSSGQFMENKTSKPYLIPGILVSLAVVSWLLYRLFGHQLITAMYDGESLGILNNLIRYQYKKAIEHYLQLGDKIFWWGWLHAFIIVPGLVLFGRFCHLKFSTDAPEQMQVLTEEKNCLSFRSGLIVLITSVIARIVWMPFAYSLAACGDERFYMSVPKMLADGYLVNKSLPSPLYGHLTLRPPLWGYLLSIPAMFSDSTFAGRVFVFLIGIWTPVLIYILTSKVFGKRNGILAGIFFALYPVHVFFSYYLWSEILFGFLMVVCCILFFMYIKNQEKVKLLYLAAFAGGITLLAKEFSVIMAGGFVVTLLLAKTKNVTKKLAICGLLFLLPATIYSVTVSSLLGEKVILNDASLGNFRISAGMESDLNKGMEGRRSRMSELLGSLAKQKPGKFLKNIRKNSYNLWTPNSQPVIRIFGIHEADTWSYKRPIAKFWGYLSIWGYIFVAGTGFAALCLSRGGPFKTFSVATLVLLTLTSVLAFLCSRFRIPFMFILAIYSAMLFTNWRTLLGELRKPYKVVLMLLILEIFGNVIYSKWPVLGLWG